MTFDKKNYRYFFYLLYCSLFLIIYFLLISMVVFIHFLLNHDFISIEDWIFRNSWKIIIISKIFGLFIFLYFLSIFSRSLKSFIKDIIASPGAFALKKNFFAFIMFLIISMILVGRPELVYKKINFSTYSYLFWSYLGVTLFYLADSLIILCLSVLFPITHKKDYILTVLFFSTIFYFSSIQVTKESLVDVRTNLIVQYLSLFILIHMKNLGFSSAFFYALLIIAPLNTFMGPDLVWGMSYKVIEFKFNLSLFHYIILWIIALTYLLNSNRKLHD